MVFFPLQHGLPEEVIPTLQPSQVITQSEVTDQELRAERRVRDAIKASNAKLQLCWNSTLYHIDDLPFREDLLDMPNVFTPVKKELEAHCSVRFQFREPAHGEIPKPALPEGVGKAFSWEYEPKLEDIPVEPHVIERAKRQPPANAVLSYQGGETTALNRLKYYTHDTGLVRTYLDTRNGMLGGDYSTKLSAWLSHGCISPRRVYWEIERFKAQHDMNGQEQKSCYWVVFELTWRDYFKFLFIRQGNALFWHNGLLEENQVKWTDDDVMFEAWKNGVTGWPLVDANMRELNHTGFMSNRGRQNVASYLCLDLNIDWRRGADYFERMLIDHDVCSNYGNWVGAAGCTGGRINRFNIAKQSKQYDPDGEYIRAWVPELLNVPREHIHEPWHMPKKVGEQAGCVVGKDYPIPPKSRFRSNIPKVGYTIIPWRTLSNVPCSVWM